MAGRGALRASDADREQVAERLHRAMTEGRLLTEEFEQRLEASFAARTYAQLDAVLADLPGRGLTAPRQRRPARVSPALVAVVAVPVGVVVVLAAVLAVTGVFAGWLLWLAAGWLFFGRRHRRQLRRARYVRRPRARGRWDRASGRPRGYWV